MSETEQTAAEREDGPLPLPSGLQGGLGKGSTGSRLLETARLRLRRWRPDDLPWLAAINADSEVTRYLGGGPMTLAETEAQLHRIHLHWDQWGYGLWAVERLDAGRMIGFIGPSHHRWYPGEVEFGWRLERASWGRGLATEGAAAGLEHAFIELGLERLISVIHEGNLASRRVAEKSGFWLERREAFLLEETGKTLPILVYRLDRESWRADAARVRAPH